MANLYIRHVQAEIGPVDGGSSTVLDSLDGNPGYRIAGRIEASNSNKPDKGTIQIYNPSEAQIAEFQEDNRQIVLRAGYGLDTPPVVFQGAIDAIDVGVARNDVILTIAARDGGDIQTDAVFNETFTEIDTNTLIKLLAEKLGIGVGFQAPALQNVSYVYGLTLTGSAYDSMTQAVTDAGGSWSIQDRQIIITVAGGTTTESAVVLDTGALTDENTGLLRIGPRKRKNKTDGIRGTSLMNALIRPKRQVVVEARRYFGRFVVDKATHDIDSDVKGRFETSFEAREVVDG